MRAGGELATKQSTHPSRRAVAAARCARGCAMAPRDALARSALAAVRALSGRSASSAAQPLLERTANIGQPTPGSHPHLMARGDVSPGISGAEYAARRAALSARMPPHSCALLAAAPVLRFHNTIIPVPSAYRQARRRSCAGCRPILHGS
jgi:hypothetical protein